MKMTQKNKLTILFCYLISFVLLIVELAPGQVDLNVKTDSLIQSGIELSIQHDYSKAELIFQQLIEEHPDQPVGYFFMAATIQSKMVDYESDRWSQDFYRYIRLTIQCAERHKLETQEQHLWSLFYHGSALCYLAFCEGRNSDFLKAITHGLSGISILKSIIKIKPEFHDAYFGIGSYKYWRSRKTKFFNWLPLVSDDREEGIDMVWQVVEQGKYTKYAAMNELIWILLDSGKPDEAYRWALRGLGKFPQSRFFLWGAAKSAFVLENYGAAVTHFQELLVSIINSPVDNYYNEYICRVKLAQCYVKLGKLADAFSQVNIIESLPLSAGLEKKLNKQREELSRLKNQLAFVAKTEYPVASLTAKHNFADHQCRQ